MQLKIEKLVHGGRGLARSETGVVFVEGVCAGELVEATVQKSAGGVPVALVTRILESAPERIVPQCPLFGRCGGCEWQHIRYDAQVVSKVSIFKDCLERIAKLKDMPAIEVVTADSWNYRIRAQFKSDNVSLGFFKRNSHTVVPIHDCPLLVAPLNMVLSHQKEYAGTLTFSSVGLKVIAGSEGSVASTPVLAGFTQREITISVGASEFRVSGNSFFQNNSFLLERLAAWVAPFCAGKQVVDLYGGAGFFAICSGKAAESALLVENDPLSVSQARQNFTANDCANMSAVCMTAERFLLTADKKKMECLIVDPPRPGLSASVRESVAIVKPQTVVYVSCNPSTQARDLQLLLSKGEYEIEKAVIFDLYPQTHHLETVVVLGRR
jgi:23S rRNA (uracil1939-C5)-methyltransferase